MSLVFWIMFSPCCYANVLEKTIEIEAQGLSSTPIITKINPEPASNNATYKLGIDLSHHNTVTNWESVKRAGIEFAIIRTSYGWSDWDKQTDKRLKENINGAKAAGIPIGAYHYSYATTIQEAEKEADFFIEKLKGTAWEYPVFMDFEDKCQAQLSKSQKTDVMLAFLQKVQNAGYYTGYYTFLNLQKDKIDNSRLGAHELWIAHWSDNCRCESPYGIWQYTSDGSVPGIEGRVDMNRCYVDYPSIIKGMHLNGF